MAVRMGREGAYRELEGAYGLGSKRDFAEVWGQPVQVEGKTRTPCRDWENQCVQAMTTDLSQDTKCVYEITGSQPET